MQFIISAGIRLIGVVKDMASVARSSKHVRKLLYHSPSAWEALHTGFGKHILIGRLFAARKTLPNRSNLAQINARSSLVSASSVPPHITPPSAKKIIMLNVEK